MRSPDHPVERDLDVADLRRPTPVGSVKRGHGAARSRRGLRRYLLGAMVVVVLALFSAVVWFAYQDLMPGGDTVPPLIRADAGELKREPDERGGLPVVNAESAVVQALDEPESPVRVERIVPREAAAPRSSADVIPEILAVEAGLEAESSVAAEESAFGGEGETLVVAPLAVPALATAEADDAAGTATATDTLDTLLAEIIEGPEDLAAIEPAAGPFAEDDGLPLPDDGMALPEALAAEPEALAAEPEALMAEATSPVVTGATEAPATAATTLATAPTPAPATTTTAPAAASTTAAAPPAPRDTTPRQTTPRQTTPPETTVAALPSPALAPTFNGAFRVQLLAVRDQDAAAGAWSGLQQRFPTALGPLRSQVQRAEIGGGTFYRLHAGPFADRSGASAVCEALQSQGVDCFVVAPTS